MLDWVDFFIIFSSISAIVLIRLLNSPPKPAILNVYPRKPTFYWLKVIFMCAVLNLRKFGRRRKIEAAKRKNQTFGSSVDELERAQKFSYHNKAIDAVYFNGAGKNGDYLVTGTARRKNRLVDGFLYLKINSSGLGVLETPKLPGTSLYQTEEIQQFGAEGILLEPIEPMKKWKITYGGKMKRHEDRSQVHEVQINVEWTSKLPYFNFDTDMDSFAMAKGIAFEKWSRNYFKVMEEVHQTHYEQFGDLKGTVVIDGKEYEVGIEAVRDHTFGTQREWRNFHRYGLHFLSAENGDRFNVGIVSMPLCFASLPIGYVYQAKEGKIYPVQSCDLALYQHGEGGNPPTDYAFSFAAGGKKYVMQVNVIDSPHFYLSKDWESKVVERLCTFDINGIKGWGSAEWQYRNVQGKQVEDYFEM